MIIWAFICVYRSISTRTVPRFETERLKQDELDIKCLQLLRGMIHNELCKLPDNWEQNMDENAA